MSVEAEEQEDKNVLLKGYNMVFKDDTSNFIWVKYMYNNNNNNNNNTNNNNINNISSIIYQWTDLNQTLKVGSGINISNNNDNYMNYNNNNNKNNNSHNNNFLGLWLNWN